MNLVKVEQPAVLPVSVSDCKRDIRLTESDQDFYIQELIGGAVDFVDGPFGVLNRALVTQTWKMVGTSFPGCMEIPLAPVQSISIIDYFDSDNVAQTYATSNYILTGDSDRAYIEATDTATLPSTYDRPDAVSITFVAGYGDSAEDVPSSIRMAIRIMVSHWFENPVAVSPDSIHAMPFSFEALIAQYRRGVVG